MAFDDVCKCIYVTTRLLSFINCRINQGRIGNWKDFLMGCFYFNNILIQILRFAYFPVTNSKEKISFHRHFNVKKCFNTKKSRLTEHIYEINWIKGKCLAILIRHCCHSNRRSTLSIDSTWYPESYSMHNFSFILFRNIHRQFVSLKFAFFPLLKKQ